MMEIAPRCDFLSMTIKGIAMDNIVCVVGVLNAPIALECIADSNCTNYVVYSDSFSFLQAVARLKTDHHFVTKVIQKNESAGIIKWI